MREALYGTQGFRFCAWQVSGSERKAGEEQVAENRLTGQERAVEKFRRARTKPARFEQPSFIVKNHSLIQIHQPGPHKILFAYKFGSRLGEQFERSQRFPELTAGHGLKRLALRFLVPHPQFLKTQKTFVSGLLCLGAQV